MRVVHVFLKQIRHWQKQSSSLGKEISGRKGYNIAFHVRDTCVSLVIKTLKKQLLLLHWVLALVLRVSFCCCRFSWSTLFLARGRAGQLRLRHKTSLGIIFVSFLFFPLSLSSDLNCVVVRDDSEIYGLTWLLSFLYTLLPMFSYGFCWGTRFYHRNSLKPFHSLCRFSWLNSFFFLLLLWLFAWRVWNPLLCPSRLLQFLYNPYVVRDSLEQYERPERPEASKGRGKEEREGEREGKSKKKKIESRKEKKERG